MGFGAIGKYLAAAVTSSSLCHELELAFVWEPMNPSEVRNSVDVPTEAVLDSIDDFADKRADLIIEVAHPSISEYAFDAQPYFPPEFFRLRSNVCYLFWCRKYGVRFLQHADYMPASTTAFADSKVCTLTRVAIQYSSEPVKTLFRQTETALRAEAERIGTGNGMYIPSGALWGARDIQKMSQGGSLKGLRVTMKKAPHHLKVASNFGTRLPT